MSVSTYVRMDTPCPLCVNAPVLEMEISTPDPYAQHLLRHQVEDPGPFLRWRCRGGCEVKVRTADQVTRYAEYFRLWFQKGQKEAQRKAGPK